MHPWLAALRHDLIKRAVWPARDLRDTGRRDPAALRRGLTTLVDEEGAPICALELWARFRRDAPAPPAACEAFESILRHALSSLDSPWPAPLHAVLELEPAFEALARSVNSTEPR